MGDDAGCELMPFTFTTDDFAVFDFTELVIFTRRGSGVEDAAYPGVPALWEAFTGAIVPGQPQQLPERTVVHLKASALPFKPARGDRITRPSGAVYEVESGDLQTQAVRHRLNVFKRP